MLNQKCVDGVMVDLTEEEEQELLDRKAVWDQEESERRSTKIKKIAEGKILSFAPYWKQLNAILDRDWETVLVLLLRSNRP